MCYHHHLFAARLCFYLLSLLLSLPLVAQDADLGCLSPADRDILQTHIDQRRGLTKAVTTDKTPRFRIPLDCHDNGDCFAITNYVDHEAAYPGDLRDYQGGTRTYDTQSGYNHSGTDFLLWPFAWQQMRDETVTVVAAAAGVIVEKRDGSGDMNCQTGNSNGSWNAVAVEHTDGSMAWYGHLKKDGLTAKAVGEWVREGEFIGFPGSSGSSTAPHLHFEVVDALGNLIDPFAGVGNPTTAASWWQKQPDYDQPALLRLMTHFDPPKIGCHDRETVNELEYFQPGMTVFVGAYLRDQRGDQVLDFRLRRPDGSLFQRWDNQLAIDYQAVTFWYWNLPLPVDAPSGVWQVEVDFLGETHYDHFSVGDLDAPKLTQFDLSSEATAPGGPIRVSWQCENATEVRLQGDPRRFAPSDSAVLQPLSTQELTLEANGPGGSLRQAFQVNVPAGEPRLIAHITRPNAGFFTRFSVFNKSDREQPCRLIPYRADGGAEEAFTFNVPAGVTLSYDQREWFGEAEIAHCRIIAPPELVVTTAYAAADNGSPAFVGETNTLAAQWRLYPGDWSQVWDGLALVNPQDQAVQVEIELIRADGGVDATVQPSDLAQVPANGKALIVLEEFGWRPQTGDAIVVRATAPIALLALRGDREGSRFLWQNLALPEQP